jgi:hypothetical protein
MNLLFESKVLNLIVNEPLPYLNEYLILSGGISAQEGAELLVEVEVAVQTRWEKIKTVFKEEMAKLVELRNKKLATAGKDADKISKIRNWFAKRVAELRAGLATSKRAIFYAGRKAGEGISSAASKTGNLFMKTVTHGGEYGPDVKKLSKTRVGLAATAAAGLGYAGYRAYKNRKKQSEKK